MKLKLLKDLPGFPEGTVFFLEDNYEGKPVWVWQHMRDRAMVGSGWLQDLLYGQLPEPNDECEDFFEQIIEDGDKYYAVGYDGEIKEFHAYSWWGNPDAPNVFEDRQQAEQAANSIKQIFPKADGPVSDLVVKGVNANTDVANPPSDPKRKANT